MVRNHCPTHQVPCVHSCCVCSVLHAHAQFCRFDKADAITDRHSDTTIFQLRAHWVWISWFTGSEKSFRHVPPLGVEPSTSCVQGEHPIHQARLSACYQLSACPLVSMIKLFKRRIIRYITSSFFCSFIFCFPFCKQVFGVFSREFQNNR